MVWQDLAFSVGGFILAGSLIPTIRGKEKPALFTSLMTTILLFVFAFTMASLSLWLSALANAANATGWTILALQKYRQRNN